MIFNHISQEGKLPKLPHVYQLKGYGNKKGKNSFDILYTKIINNISKIGDFPMDILSKITDAMQVVLNEIDNDTTIIYRKLKVELDHIKKINSICPMPFHKKNDTKN